MKKLLFLLPLLACILMGCHDEPKPTPPKYPTYPTFNADDCAALHDLYVALGVDTDQLYDWPHWIIPKFDGVTLERDWDADELRVVRIDMTKNVRFKPGYRLDASFDFTRFERLKSVYFRFDTSLGEFELSPSLFNPQMEHLDIRVSGDNKTNMTLPNELFGCKQTLKSLTLSGIRITDPDFFKKITEFRPECYLKFMDNGFKGALPLEVIKLKNLDLSYNDFSEVDVEYFYNKNADLPQLWYNTQPISIPSKIKDTKWWVVNSQMLHNTELIWIEP